MTALERIYSELNSREFTFTAGGQKFTLPSLGTKEMKKVLLESRSAVMNEAGEYHLEQHIRYMFDHAGNPDWIRTYPRCSRRDLRKIYNAWFDWSGYTAGKSTGPGCS